MVATATPDPWIDAPASGRARFPLGWTPTAAALLLAVTTLTFRDPIGPQFGSLDAVALIKVAVRVLTIAVLGGAIAYLWTDEFRTPIRRALTPLLLFVLWAALSTVWSPLRNVTFGQTLSLLALVCLAAACAVLCRTRSDFSRSMFFLNRVLFVAAALVLLIHFALPGIGTLSRESQGLMHPTNAAACSCIGILHALGGMWVCRWGHARGMTTLILLTHAVVILLAMNRWGPVVMAAVALVLMFLYAPRGGLALAAVGASLLVTLYVASDPGFKATEPLVAKLIESSTRGQTQQQIKRLSGREVLWEKIWRSHQQSPWIGHGYFVTSATGSIDVWGEKGNRTAHNFVLQVLVSTGRIGLLLFVAGLLVPIAAIVRGLSHTRLDRELLGYLGLLLSWFIGWSFFNETIAGPLTPETVAFFVLLGCGLGVACRRTAARSRALGLRFPDLPLARGYA